MSSAPVTEPMAENGAGIEAVTCPHCARQVAPGANQCGVCGRWLPANQAAYKHGLRSRVAGLPDDLKVSIEQFREGVIADQGGVGELSHVRAGLVRLLVDCEVARHLLMREIHRADAGQGIAMSTKPGRAALDRLHALMDRYVRIASTLGLERRQRRVPGGSAAILDSPVIEADR